LEVDEALDGDVRRFDCLTVSYYGLCAKICGAVRCCALLCDEMKSFRCTANLIYLKTEVERRAPL
jgi:hypothetical protein